MLVKKYLLKTPVEAVQFQGLDNNFKKWFENNWSSSYGIDGNPNDSKIVILGEDGSEYILEKGCWLVKDCRGAFQIVPDDLFKINYQECKDN